MDRSKIVNQHLAELRRQHGGPTGNASPPWTAIAGALTKVENDVRHELGHADAEPEKA